jgi:flagellar motility protein MotE (MotC chaperone)
MSEAGAPNAPEDLDWPRNYFNYFTEIEDHFQRARGSGLFLLSPLDWALIESWKNSEIPLQAVLKGIDEAFDKWRSRKIKRRFINSLAYCTQAVMQAAERAPSRADSKPSAHPPFTPAELRSHLEKAAGALRQRPESLFQEVASTLNALAAEAAERLPNLEDLERRLTALEDKIVAALRTLESDENLYAIRADLDRELRPYRGKMTADQIVMLERRYLESALLERAKLPRLSLFYLH